MPIVFRCPACGRDLEAPDAAYGVAGSCRFCGAQIVSPAGPDAPATLVAPGPVGMQAAVDDVSVPTGVIDPGQILSEAWDLLKVHWAIILAANLIVGAICLAVLAPVFIPVVRDAMQHPGDPGAGRLPLFSEAAFMLLSILLAPLAAGPLFLIDRIIVRGDESMGAIFAGFRHYGALVEFALLFNGPLYLLQMTERVLAGSSPFSRLAFSIATWPVILFFYVALRPGQMDIIDRGGDGITGLKASWEFTKGRRWMILVTGLVLMLCYLAGFLVFCVGGLFTAGFIPLGEVLIYRHLRGLHGTPDQ